MKSKKIRSPEFYFALLIPPLLLSFYWGLAHQMSEGAPYWNRLDWLIKNDVCLSRDLGSNPRAWSKVISDLRALSSIQVLAERVLAVCCLWHAKRKPNCKSLIKIKNEKTYSTTSNYYYIHTLVEKIFRRKIPRVSSLPRRRNTKQPKVSNTLTTVQLPLTVCTKRSLEAANTDH